MSDRFLTLTACPAVIEGYSTRMSVLAYYDHVNPDLLRLLPRDARLIVEVGCGTGALAARYKLVNPRVRYLGVERHWPAVERAAQRLDRVVYGDAELRTLEQLGIGH